METFKIPMYLRAAYLSLHRQTNAHLTRHGVTADQFVCLLLLAEEDGIIQRELVKRASSDPNTIRAMLVLLENKGFIIRIRHPIDGRARIVSITDKGRQVFEDLINDLKPVRDRLTEQFSEDEAVTINKFLNLIFSSMQ